MASVNLTPREIEILTAYVKESKGDVDWTKVAAASKCKTAKYARDKFASIRNKIIAACESGNGTGGGDDANDAGADGEKAAPASKTKKKATPTKRKKDADDDESPTKKTKGSKDKVETAADEDVPVKAEPNEAGEMMDELDGFN